MAIKVELWELCGDCWRLPLRVVWMDTLAEVRIGNGVPLTEKMRAAAEEKMSKVAQRRGHAFFCIRLELEKVAVKSEHDDPQDVIEWRPTQVKAKSEGLYRAPEFIAAYCTSPFALIRSPLMADAVWTSFCKFMAHWLVNVKKPVDLLFAELASFPFRKNWQGTVAKWEHKEGYNRWKNPNVVNMIQRGVADYMVSGYVTAYDEKSKTCRNTLHVLETDDWHKANAAREIVGEEPYPERMAQALRRVLPKALEYYSAFVREAKFPCMAVAACHKDRTTGKWTWQSGSHKTTPGSGAWHLAKQMPVVPVESSQPGTMAEKDAVLRQVSNLQPNDEDVRHARPELVSQS